MLLGHPGATPPHMRRRCEAHAPLWRESAPAEGVIFWALSSGWDWGGVVSPSPSHSGCLGCFLPPTSCCCTFLQAFTGCGGVKADKSGFADLEGSYKSGPVRLDKLAFSSSGKFNADIRYALLPLSIAPTPHQHFCASSLLLSPAYLMLLRTRKLRSSE
jgi:hypothetical protein